MHKLVCARNTCVHKSVKGQHTLNYIQALFQWHTHTYWCPYEAQESLQQTAASSSDWQLNPNPFSSPLMIWDGGNQEDTERERGRGGGRALGLWGTNGSRWLEANEEGIQRAGGWVSELEMRSRKRDAWKSDQWTEVKKERDGRIWQLQWKSERERRIRMGGRLKVIARARGRIQ